MDDKQLPPFLLVYVLYEDASVLVVDISADTNVDIFCASFVNDINFDIF
ncbi:hypothetical protein [Staphylococcus schweitzeri]|nr:hypothetical protein [Staphylococcus schweitzeri]